MDVIKTSGKIIDSVVIVSSLAVGVASAMTIYSGVKDKTYGKVAIGIMTLLIGGYAIKAAATSINK